MFIFLSDSNKKILKCICFKNRMAIVVTFRYFDNSYTQ